MKKKKLRKLLLKAANWESKVHKSEYLCSKVPFAEARSIVIDKICDKYKEKKKETILPEDAHSLEVFEIRDNVAYIGYKLKSGCFHYIQVPYTKNNNKWNL
jgi:hypothetical protein